MARRAKARAKPKKAPRARGLMGRILRVLMLLILLFGFIGPVAVVILYRYVPPPMTFLMVQRLFEGRGFDRRWVPISDISPRLVGAVIATTGATQLRHETPVAGRPAVHRRRCAPSVSPFQ